MNVSGMSAPWASAGVAGGRGMQRPPQLPDEAVDALANKLGMSSDELKTKLESGDDPRRTLDQLAQEKGISTNELRETVRSTMSSRLGQAGPPPPPPGAGGVFGSSFDAEIGQKVLSALADALGTSTDELQSQLESGTDLQQLLDDKDVTPDDIRAAFQEAFKSWQSYGWNGNASQAYMPDFQAVDAQL
ncbi:MAG: hypothetical protein U0821_27525 [Chloroflexota bacterium]